MWRKYFERRPTRPDPTRSHVRSPIYFEFYVQAGGRQLWKCIDGERGVTEIRPSTPVITEFIPALRLDRLTCMELWRGLKVHHGSHSGTYTRSRMTYTTWLTFTESQEHGKSQSIPLTSAAFSKLTKKNIDSCLQQRRERAYSKAKYWLMYLTTGRREGRLQAMIWSQLRLLR